MKDDSAIGKGYCESMASDRNISSVEDKVHYIPENFLSNMIEIKTLHPGVRFIKVDAMEQNSGFSVLIL